jgi:hypothetical protein
MSRVQAESCWESGVCLTLSFVLSHQGRGDGFVVPGFLLSPQEWGLRGLKQGARNGELTWVGRSP